MIIIIQLYPSILTTTHKLTKETEKDVKEVYLGLHQQTGYEHIFRNIGTGLFCTNPTYVLIPEEERESLFNYMNCLKPSEAKF